MLLLSQPTCLMLIMTYPVDIHGRGRHIIQVNWRLKVTAYFLFLGSELSSQHIFLWLQPEGETDYRKVLILPAATAARNS